MSQRSFAVCCLDGGQDGGTLRVKGIVLVVLADLPSIRVFRHVIPDLSQLIIRDLVILVGKVDRQRADHPARSLLDDCDGPLRRSGLVNSVVNCIGCRFDIPADAADGIGAG